MEHRKEGYGFLRGEGLEIGAFHQPAPLPEGCQVTYCDAFTKEEAIELFPELNFDDLVTVDRVCDLDIERLSPFASNSVDFVILNHVIEHVANPVRVIHEVFRVTKRRGRVVVSAPDKEFTFDKDRNLTPFEHLLSDYRNDVTEVSDDHYIDFLMGVYPGMRELDESELAKHVAHVKKRRVSRELLRAYWHRAGVLIRKYGARQPNGILLSVGKARNNMTLASLSNPSN